MKTTIPYRWLLLSAVGLCASFLMACQKDSGGGGSVAPVNSCGANYINSQYGCVPSCGNGMGMVQNQCVAVAAAGACAYGAQQYGNGQCLPTQGTCQSGYIWSGSGCVFASTGQPYPNAYQQYGYPQQYGYAQPQPYPLYGGYYGYGQSGYSQPVPVYPYGYGGGFRAGFSVGFGY